MQVSAVTERSPATTTTSSSFPPPLSSLLLRLLLLLLLVPRPAPPPPPPPPLLQLLRWRLLQLPFTVGRLQSPACTDVAFPPPQYESQEVQMMTVMIQLKKMLPAKNLQQKQPRGARTRKEHGRSMAISRSGTCRASPPFRICSGLISLAGIQRAARLMQI